MNGVLFTAKTLVRGWLGAEARGALRLRRRGAVSAFSLLCLAMPGLILSGCGGSSGQQAKAGPITFTNSSGAAEKVTSLAVTSAVKLSMMPTGDSINGGVDWVIACGGNPISGSITNGGCGSLSSLHTADGAPTTYTAPSLIPIGTSVTITATVTSNPSQSSRVSLTIVATPISVAFDPALPIPSSLLVNATLMLGVQVTNDPSSGGVTFTATCGSSACGSFNPAVTTPGESDQSTYTAPSSVPAGNTVTITATSSTDPSKSASVTLTITAPSSPPSVAISVAPLSLYAETTGSAHSAHITAIVANDPQAEGVNWSVSCGGASCGSITAHTASDSPATYVAPATVPPGGTVSITASSTTNPAVSASATANIVTTAPIVVTLSSPPAPSQTVGAQATLAATTTGDTANLGVNWTASCSGGACGSFNLTPAHTASGGQIIYTAPATVPPGGVVTIMASSAATTPANPGVAFTTIVPQPPSVSFQQAPPSAMTSAAQASVIATVTNDVPPGGVTWSVQCGSTVPGGCGWIAPVQTASGATATYTAPPVTATGTAVTVIATSVAEPSVSVSSNPITINPSTTPTVSFIPSLPSQMQPNATVNLTAGVANDSTNAGIDWQVCSSGCGFFTVQPAIPAIPATATTPFAAAVPAVTATSVSGWSNDLPIPYTAPPQAPPAGTVAILAKSHANNAQATSGTITISSSSFGPAVTGVVQAGTQPVVGASVALYAAGTSGYASASTSMGTAVTDKNGSFTIAGTYSCPSPASQMYVVATSGKVGANATNPNLALMAVLGPCSNLGSAPVIVNEVTSVAAAYATAAFAANDALTGNNSYLYLGTSSGNSAGLANAFATAISLADITTGQARFFVPAGNGAAPYVQINTVADMLNACTATSGGQEGDGTACGALFTGADVLSQHTLFNSVAPTDTLQAAFNIAQHPVSNYGYQLGLPNQGGSSSLATLDSPFQPILSSNPNGDWSLSLNYTVGGLPADTLGSFALDATGNLWITDATAGTVIEWNSTGAAVSPSAGYAAGGGPIGIDANGNVWISGNGSLSELSSLGIPMPGSPFAGVAGGGSDMAIDAQDDIWIANGAGVSEFSDLGAELSPAGGYTNSAYSGVNAVSVDSSGNVWLGLLGTGSGKNFAILTNPGGQLIAAGQPLSDETIIPEMAADDAGEMWFVTQLDVCRVPPYAGAGSILTGSCMTGNGPQSGDLPFNNPQGIALDGAGTAWLASAGGGSSMISPNIVPIILGGGTNSPPLGYTSPSLAAGTVRVGIDGSGNVWVLLANHTVTEYIGAAAPTTNPTALAVKNTKLGAKP
jgi:hypothetical protein